MASPGTVPAAARPARYRRAPTWLLWAVLAAHVLGIEWMARHTTGRGLLQSMAEPEFNQSLTLQGQRGSSDAPPTSQDDLPPAPPTVGQVVQARTVVPPRTSSGERTDLKTKQSPRPTPPTRPATPPQPPTHAEASDEPATGTVAAETNLTGTDEAPARDHTALPNAPPAEPSPPPQTGEMPATAAAQAPPLPATPPATVVSGTATDDPAIWLATWPRSTRLNYQLKGYFRGDFHGTARVQWQRSAQRYQAQIHANVGLLFDMRMTSQGRITATRLWPEAYEEERRGKKRGARFGDQAVTLDNGNTLNRPAQLQDTASQFVQLAQDFATKRLPLQVDAVVPVTLGRPGGIDDWVYDVVAMETLPTPMGDLTAYHLKPRPLPHARGTVSAEIWFAPALQHLPVRIRLSLTPEIWLDLTLDSVAQSD